MKILGREFIGPLKVEYQTLPKDSGVCIITHVHKEQIKPLYIIFTKDIKHRIHSLLIEGPIPKEKLKDDELKLFYLVFEDEHHSKGKRFERELIETFEPTFNTNIFQSSKSSWESQIFDKKIENARKFSSFVAAFVSSIAIAATLYLSTGVLFESRKNNQNPAILASNEITANYSKTVKKIEDSKKDIESIKVEIKALSTKPVNANWLIESDKLNRRVSSIEFRLSALETALTVDPAKSLAIPLLRKDLDNTQNAFKIELAQSKSEVDRVYDQNKWFIGMMVTVAVAVLGMAINNFFTKKS